MKPSYLTENHKSVIQTVAWKNKGGKGEGAPPSLPRKP